MSSSWIDQVKLDHYLKKLQQNDPKALAEIYQTMYPMVFHYTFSLVRNYEEAEDITQEVFLRINRYKHKYKVGTSAKAWIYKMTKNLIYTTMKKKKEIAYEKEKLEYLIDQQAILPTTDLSFVKEALDCLNETERQVVTLHLYGGLKHYETAQVLNIPYEKVRSIYTYALRKMEKQLKKGAFL